MAQYYWEPDSGDVGGSPSNLSTSPTAGAFDNITVENSHPNSTVDGDISSSDRPLLVLDQPGDGNYRGVSFDAINGRSVPDSQNVEVFIRLSTVGGSIVGLGGARIDTGSGDGLYSGHAREFGEEQITHFTGSGFSSIASESNDYGTHDPTNVRFRYDGTDLRARIWRGGEPTGWDLNTTDGTVTRSGAVGVVDVYGSSLRNDDFDTAIFQIGIGTDGDPAPTAPLDPANYQISSFTNTTSNAGPGDPVNFDYSINNTGEIPGDQTVTLSIDGVGQVDSTTETIDAGSSGSGTLTWSSAGGGSYTATLATDDDTANTSFSTSQPVTVAAPAGGATDTSPTPTLISRVTTTVGAGMPSVTAGVSPVTVDAPITATIGATTPAVVTASPAVVTGAVQNPTVTPTTPNIATSPPAPALTTRVTATVAVVRTVEMTSSDEPFVRAIGPGQIIGTVLDRGEQPVEGVDVVAVIGGEADAGDTTDSNGEFELIVSDEREEYHVIVLADETYFSYPFTTADPYGGSAGGD